MRNLKFHIILVNLNLQDDYSKDVNQITCICKGVLMPAVLTQASKEQSDLGMHYLLFVIQAMFS